MTLNEQTFRQRGEVEQATLAIEKKEDLRRSHFEIGREKEPIYTLNQLNYNDKAKLMPKLTFATKHLRESHFSLGDGKGDFVSQHMLSYRPYY